MKRFIAIISLLLVIYIGLYFYRKQQIQNVVTIKISDVEEIDEYMQKIYMWKEITNEAIPCFDDINSASDLWVWEVVRKNIDQYEVDEEEIQNTAKIIFGPDFKMEFPREGTNFLKYDEAQNKYKNLEINLDKIEDNYILKNIEKTDDGYNVQIVEYLEDYQNEISGILIKNLDEKVVAMVNKDESRTQKIEIIKENVDKFSVKNIDLKKDLEGNIYISKVQ